MRCTASARLVLFAAGLVPAAAQNPYLTWSPTSVTLEATAGSATPVTVRVRLTNSGNAFNFLASGNQGWFSSTPTSGTLAAGGTIEFVISADPTGMQTGTYTAAFTVTPGPGTGLPPSSIEVTFNVTGFAFLTVPESLEFTVGPEATDAKSFSVSLSDGIAREVVATPYTGNTGNWLAVLNSAPITTPTAINVRVSAAGLEIGTVLQGEIRLTAPALPGLQKSIPIKMTVVDRSPGYSVVPSHLNFYSFSTTQPPAQPVQVFASADRRLPFDVVKSPGSTPLSASLTRGITPITFTASMDTSLTPELPRDDSMSIVPLDGSSEIVVPIRTSIEPARVYAIPQVADGGGFRTAFTVVNNDPATALIALRFYKSDPVTHATSAWTPAMENNERVDNIQIPAGASWTVQTAGAATGITSGWAEVVCASCTGNSKGVSGLAVFRQAQPDGRIQEAAVPINASLMQRSFLPYDNAGGMVTSMAIANISQTEVAKVRVAFRDASGRVLRIDRVKDIPPRGHFAFELIREFPYLNGTRGTADFWITSGQISILGLRFSPSGAFTSFEAQTLNRRAFGRRSLPQIADGGEFRTSITLVNNDSAVAQVRLRFWRATSNGATEGWTLGFVGGINPDNLTIPPGSSITLESAGASPTVQSGWAEVVTDQWVTGLAVFRQSLPGRPDQEAAVPVNVATPNRLLLPFDNTGGFTTSVALINMSAAVPAQVNLTFRDGQGLRIFQTALPEMPVQGHRAFNLGEQYPQLKGLKGTMELSALSGEVSLLGLRFSDAGAYTSFRAQPVQ
ncbi:MAG: hypothetical protein HZB13_04895 [Acidobacteria bacterium]|nr:hypothetical protein [Acidobacteriota bacterium]